MYNMVGYNIYVYHGTAYNLLTQINTVHLIQLHHFLPVLPTKHNNMYPLCTPMLLSHYTTLCVPPCYSLTILPSVYPLLSHYTTLCVPHSLTILRSVYPYSLTILPSVYPYSHYTTLCVPPTLSLYYPLCTPTLSLYYPLCTPTLTILPSVYPYSILPSVYPPMLLSHLHSLRWVTPKYVFRVGFSSLQYFNYSQTMKVIYVYNNNSNT